MPRAHAAELYNGLKTAWKQLVGDIGGIDAVAACTRTTRSLAGDFGSLNADRFAPIDVVLDAEAIAGRPHVTAALARAQGYMLLPLAPRHAGDLSRVLAELSSDVGRTFADAVAALAHPALSPDERATLIRDLDEVARVAAEARCLLQQPPAAPVPPARQPRRR